MNKKSLGILVLLSFIAAIAVFAADKAYRCKAPADGSVYISHNGSTVLASYSGKSAQKFDVIVYLKDKSTKIVSFSFSAVSNEQTRVQSQSAGGEIETVVI